MKRYRSNLELVLAAYNAGEGNVAKYSNQILN
ncbi:transglycosylase SLT domain-containing protein [Citrobacter freundii]|nr:transglycosylase SLT domain-containing protein [Citrobacter freundii]